jgi:hypothetical protein
MRAKISHLNTSVGDCAKTSRLKTPQEGLKARVNTSRIGGRDFLRVRARYVVSFPSNLNWTDNPEGARLKTQDFPRVSIR